MTNRLIYLQYGFWKSIYDDKSVEGRKLFWDIYSALQLSNICADIPEGIWEEENNPLYYLIQDSADGYGTQIEMNNPNKIESAINLKNKNQLHYNLFAVYLLDEEEEKCVEYGNHLGVLCLNAKMIKERCSYVLGGAIDYKKGEEYDQYSKCDNLFSPCNSLILIDPYILKGKYNPRFDIKTNSILINLIPLLYKLLPQTLDIPFHLSIFSQAFGCVTETNNNANGEEVYDYLEQEIRKIRPQLTIKLSLCHVKTTGDGDGDFHSRHILTNCMAINSEDGFDLFKNKKDRRNNIKCVSGKYARIEIIHPVLSNNKRLESDNYYQWIKISSHNTNNNLDYIGWGKFENRLFKLVQ